MNQVWTDKDFCLPWKSVADGWLPPEPGSEDDDEPLFSVNVLLWFEQPVVKYDYEQCHYAIGYYEYENAVWWNQNGGVFLVPPKFFCMIGVPEGA